jgi:structural maintenance of chromosome 2
VQDLIYLNGQAGVKEASVTICFDNKDKSKSPNAYKEFDMINVTRKIIVSFLV